MPILGTQATYPAGRQLHVGSNPTSTSCVEHAHQRALLLDCAIERVALGFNKTEPTMRKKHIDPAAGRRLSEIRQYRGISQGELAKALAVKVGTIQGYEHARIDISATRLDQLARGLQCETADLVMPPGAPLPRYLYHHQGRRQQRRRSAAQRRQTREGSEPSRSADTNADWITYAGAAEGIATSRYRS